MSATTVTDAVSYLTQGAPNGPNRSHARPNPSDVVAALARAEKQSKKEKQCYAYEQLIGSWQLGFVSGTRKGAPSRQGAKPIKQLGKGRFLPRWVDITITYGPQQQLLSPKLLDTPKLDTEEGTAEVSGGASEGERAEPQTVSAENGSGLGNGSRLGNTVGLGAVVNRVGLGGVSLQLSGPTRYWPKTNTLGFDFVYLQGGIGPVTLYDAPVRGGVEKAKAFADVPLKDQAFFTFLAVEPHYIAARGKGGGLALWTRVIPR